jgi:hypothetical protein
VKNTLTHCLKNVGSARDHIGVNTRHYQDPEFLLKIHLPKLKIRKVRAIMSFLGQHQEPTRGG